MTKKSICQIVLFVQRVFGGGGGAEDPKSALNSRDLSQNNFHPGQHPQSPIYIFSYWEKRMSPLQDFLIPMNLLSSRKGPDRIYGFYYLVN